MHTDKFNDARADARAALAASLDDAHAARAALARDASGAAPDEGEMEVLDAIDELIANRAVAREMLAGSAFSLPLALLAEEYGVPLTGSLARYGDTPVTIYRSDHDGKWHVGGEIDGLDDDWAPSSAAAAADLRVVAGWVSEGFWG